MPDNDPLHDFGEIAISSSKKSNTDAPDSQDLEEDIQKEPDQPEIIPPDPSLTHSKGIKKRGPATFLSVMVFVAVFMVGAYYLAGTYLFPAFFMKYGPTYLSQHLRRPVSIADIRFSPFSFTIEVIDLRIGDSEDAQKDGGGFFSCNRLFLDVEGVSLFHMALITRVTELDHPVIRLVRQKDGKDTFRDMLSSRLLRSFFYSGLVNEESSGFPFRFSFNNFQIKQGRVFFEDIEEGQKHTLDDIRLTLPTVANFRYQRESMVAPGFHAVMDGSPVEIVGETDTDGDRRKTTLTLQLQDIDLPQYLSYLSPETTPRVLQGKGTLDALFIFSSSADAGSTFQVETTGTFADIRLANHRGMDFLRIPSMALHAVVRPQFNEITVHSLVLKRPELILERGGKSSSKKSAPLPFGPDTLAGISPLFKRVLVKGGMIRFVDRKVVGGFGGTWKNVQLELENFITHPGDIEKKSNSPLSSSTFVLSATSKELGNVSAQGTIAGESLVASGFVVVDAVPLNGFQPYYAASEKKEYAFSGMLKGEGNVSFPIGSLFSHTDSAKKDNPVRIDKGRFQIVHGKMTAAGRVMADIERLSGSDVVIDMETKKARLGLLRVDRPVVSLRRSDIKTFSGFPFDVSMQDLILEHGQVSYENMAHQGSGRVTDGTGKPSVLQLNDISLSGKDLTVSHTQSTANGTIRLQGTLPSAGTLRLDGAISFFPLRGMLSTTLQDGDLSQLGPFFSPALQHGSWKGIVSVDGKTRLPDMVFAGKGTINGVHVSSPVRKSDERSSVVPRFLAKQIQLNGLELSFSTGSLKSRDVVLDRPVFRISDDFLGTRVPGQEGEKSGANQSHYFWLQKKTGEHGVIIDKLKFSEGEVLFDTLGNKKTTKHAIKNVSGSVSNFVNVDGALASYTLTGQLDTASPISSSGTFRVGPALYVEETQATATHLSTSAVSAFVEKHFGWTLIQGSADISGQYSRNKGMPKAMVTVGLQDTLLKKQTSSALDLSLVNALLTDEKGRADIFIEMSPGKKGLQKGWRDLFIRHIRNMALQAQVSPALLLHKSFPDLSTSLSFAPGSAGLDDRSRRKCLSLVRMLARRPGLHVAVNSVVDLYHDKKALIEQRKVRIYSLKRKEDFKAAEKTAQIFGREEIASAASLKTVQTSENNKASTKQEKQSVTKDDLRKLGASRIQQVFSYLVEKLQLAPERITKGKVRMFPGDRNEKSVSRIDFQIKTGAMATTALK